MIACAAKITVVCCPLLLAMCGADTAVQVENDHLRWAAVMNLVDPRPAHVGQGFNVHIACQKLRLEACHLAGGCSGLLICEFDTKAKMNKYLKVMNAVRRDTEAESGSQSWAYHGPVKASG